jgi:hypothetical protein
MKQHTTILLLVMCINAIFFQLARASDWVVKISGEREDYTPYVMLGLAKEAYNLSNPPEPMGFKCNIMLKSVDDQRPLKRDIRTIGNNSYEWILAVNPHGESPPYETTCTISWNPLDIGPGKLKMLDQDGNVLINNMKTITAYGVTSSTNTYFQYRLHYQEVSLLDIIAYLQILAGIKQNSGIDTDFTGKIEMNDILNMLKDITNESKE